MSRPSLALRVWAPLFALTRNTFSEIVRQPAFAIVTVTTLLALAFVPSLSMLSLGEESNVLKDFGLSTLLLSGFVLTCVAAGNVVRREFDDRTTLTLLSKPVSRELFVLGKFLGLMGALFLAIGLFTVALLLAARVGQDLHAHGHGHDHGADHGSHLDWPVVLGAWGGAFVALTAAIWRSYRRERSFCGGLVVGLAPALFIALALTAVVSPDGEWGEIGVGLDAFVWEGAALVLFAVSVLAAFAVICALWLGRGAIFLLTALFFLGGLAVSSSSGVWSSLLVWMPDFQIFWAGEMAYVPDIRVGASYLGRALLYAGGFDVALLFLGSVLLRHRSL